MKQSATDKLLPCPFCGGQAVQKITLINTGSFKPFKHVAEIKHDCGVNSFAPRCSALELFFGDKENRELLEKVAEHQRTKWNTRHNPDANALKIAVETLMMFAQDGDPNGNVVAYAKEALAEINRMAENNLTNKGD